MAKLAYLHEDHAKSSSDIDAIFGRSNDNYTVEREGTLENYDNYLKHIEEIGQMPLAAGLSALDVEEVVSIGGFPALRVGDPDARTNLCVNTRSGINAILSMAAQKYQRLSPNAHLAWFDPRTKAQGVLTVWDPSLDRWAVFDWVNGAYHPSKSIVPTPDGKQPTNDNRRFWYQSQKHQQIKEYLTSKDYGTAFLIVMNFEDDLTHYQTKLKDRTEMSLAEVWEAVSNDWSESNAKRQMTSGKTRPNNSVPVSDKRQEFINKLSQLSTPYNVQFDSGTGNTSTILFDASDPDAKAKFLDGIRQAKPKIKFLGYEKITS